MANVGKMAKNFREIPFRKSHTCSFNNSVFILKPTKHPIINLKPFEQGGEWPAFDQVFRLY
jgi:hypothetical protein